MTKKDIKDILYEKRKETRQKKEDMYEGDELLTSHGLARVSAKMELVEEILTEVDKLNE